MNEQPHRCKLPVDTMLEDDQKALHYFYEEEGFGDSENVVVCLLFHSGFINFQGEWLGARHDVDDEEDE